MSVVVLLQANKNPTHADIDAAMAGNICRSGTYLRIRDAIKLAAQIECKEAAKHHDCFSRYRINCGVLKFQFERAAHQ